MDVAEYIPCCLQRIRGPVSSATRFRTNKPHVRSPRPPNLRCHLRERSWGRGVVETLSDTGQLYWTLDKQNPPRRENLNDQMDSALTQIGHSIKRVPGAIRQEHDQTIRLFIDRSQYIFVCTLNRATYNVSQQVRYTPVTCLTLCGVRRVTAQCGTERRR